MARPEVTGRAIAAQDAAADLVDAFSIPLFCQRHNISQAFYHKLQAQGLGPRVMRIGARTLITREAAAEWRRAREAETEGAQ